MVPLQKLETQADICVVSVIEEGIDVYCQPVGLMLSSGRIGNLLRNLGSS